MRKVLGLAAAFLVTISMSGCAMGNNGVNDRNGVQNNGGTGARRLSLQNNNNNANINYRDGVYTGYGDAHGDLNERATVEIRNGRIVDIDLANVNQRGGTITTPGTGANNQRGTGLGTNNTTGNTITPGTGNATDMRNATGTNNQAGPATGITRGNTVGMGNPAGTRNIAGTEPGTNITNGFGGGTVGGTVGTAVDRVRTDLVNMMIRDQRYDVNYVNNDTALTGTVDNWKLAVNRALAQARR